MCCYLEVSPTVHKGKFPSKHAQEKIVYLSSGSVQYVYACIFKSALNEDCRRWELLCQVLKF